MLGVKVKPCSFAMFVKSPKVASSFAMPSGNLIASGSNGATSGLPSTVSPSFFSGSGAGVGSGCGAGSGVGVGCGVGVGLGVGFAGSLTCFLLEHQKVCVCVCFSGICDDTDTNISLSLTEGHIQCVGT